MGRITVPLLDASFHSCIVAKSPQSCQAKAVERINHPENSGLAALFVVSTVSTFQTLKTK
jgi:hypothetical protein